MTVRELVAWCEKNKVSLDAELCSYNPIVDELINFTVSDGDNCDLRVYLEIEEDR